MTVHHGAADLENGAERPIEGEDGEGVGGGTGGDSSVGVMSLVVIGEGDHQKLASGSDDAAVKIWNTISWNCEQVLRAHQVGAVGGSVWGALEAQLLRVSWHCC